MLAERSGVPVLGTVPFFNSIYIAEEDAVPLEDKTAPVLQLHPGQVSNPLEVVVVRLPYLSNYDEFDALATEPLVRLRFAAEATEFPGPARSHHLTRHEEHPLRPGMALAARAGAAHSPLGKAGLRGAGHLWRLPDARRTPE